MSASQRENPPILLLISVLLPPRALDDIGLLTEERHLRTPFGSVGPMAKRVASDGNTYWIQPYSGLPDRTDPRATIYAARMLGADRILAWDSAVAVESTLQRGETAIVVDAIDFTARQPDSFHGASALEASALEMMGATSEETFTFCPAMTEVLHRAFPEAAPAIVVGVDGPRRETAAEARLFRMWGAAAICQNITPEAFLARELGIHFASLITCNGYSRDMQRPEQEGELRRGLEEAMVNFRAALPLLHTPLACGCAG
jgi:5'-methylthioadenosine phosphorylase